MFAEAKEVNSLRGALETKVSWADFEQGLRRIDEMRVFLETVRPRLPGRAHQGHSGCPAKLGAERQSCLDVSGATSLYRSRAPSSCNRGTLSSSWVVGSPETCLRAPVRSLFSVDVAGGPPCIGTPMKSARRHSRLLPCSWYTPGDETPRTLLIQRAWNGTNQYWLVLSSS